MLIPQIEKEGDARSQEDHMQFPQTQIPTNVVSRSCQNLICPGRSDFGVSHRRLILPFEKEELPFRGCAGISNPPRRESL